jgi:chemotaxis protein methyltransferase CheR
MPPGRPFQRDNRKNLMMELPGSLPSRDFMVIRDLILERSGIYIRETRNDYLEYRIKERMLANSMDNFEEYYYFLKYSPATTGEFQQLLNLITVQETSFFRNPDQLNSFKNIILKEIIAKKLNAGDKLINIWSSASSTGEEATTIAMILNETLDFPLNWQIKILGTDISTRALDMAKKGVYANARLDGVPDGYMDKYFIKKDNTFKVKESISNFIEFRHLNLSTGIYNFMGPRPTLFDVIFCRNVFIYFTDEVKGNIAKEFYKLLNPGGYLLLGNAESVDVRKVPFNMAFLPGGMVYQKPK